jgi:hypothetical protein
LVSIAIEPLFVAEMTHFAHETDKLLTIDLFDSGPSSGVTELGVDPSSVKEQSLSVLVFTIFAGDKRDDFFVARGVEISTSDGHLVFDDGSSDDLD